MRRWNGWGDDTHDYPLPEGAAIFLEEAVGPGQPPQDTPLEDVIAAVPASRLPAHPLVSTDPEARVRHARGQSLPDWVAMRAGRFGAFPDGVAFPISGEEVQALIQYAKAGGIRLIPYGGGTSVVGHINPLPGTEVPTLTVSLARLNRLERIDSASGLARFGAGINGPDLEAQLRAHGFTLGHYPQSFEFSTLGGWIATRSSGQQSLHYGRIEKLFSGGTVETPQGRLELPDFPASAAGPDLREVVLGSEGRMGVITQATVRAARLPEYEAFHAVFLPDWDRAQAAVRAIIQSDLPLSMLRLSTPVETETTLALAGHERLIGALEGLLRLHGVSEGKCMLMIGITGRAKTVKAGLGEALDIARQHGGVHVGQTFGRQWIKGRFETPYLRNTLWERGYAIDTLETAVTWDRVPQMVDGLEAALRGALAGTDERVHVFTHLSHLYPSGSSVYVTYLFRLAPDPEETLRRWEGMKRRASETIVALGGTISHQHGVGTDHAPYLPAEKGEPGMAAIRALYGYFDPDSIMNPGKLYSE
ncbi:MAG: FAD-binding oxidoreductase [Anaerolineae bacterium]|nr:FAD-binding oxidoreductase [Anaerolineae bacterium]